MSKLSSWTRRTRRIAGAGAVAAIASAGAGVAWGAGAFTSSIPDAAGVVHGCVSTSGSLRSVYLIDPSTGATCPNGFAPVSWNQQGPSGPTGVTGPNGATGASGVSGIQGASGPSGAQGVSGVTGASGPSGPKGDGGLTGSSGPSGPSGPSGAQGPAGSGTTLFAHINRDGTVGFGKVTVSAGLWGHTGAWLVDFGRDVSACAVDVTATGGLSSVQDGGDYIFRADRPGFSPFPTGADPVPQTAFQVETSHVDPNANPPTWDNRNVAFDIVVNC